MVAGDKDRQQLRGLRRVSVLGEEVNGAGGPNHVWPWVYLPIAYLARLTPEGYGSDQPVASNGSAIGRALNRRVEVSHGLP
jgi:hypothetical protein